MNEKPQTVTRFSSPLARDLYVIGAAAALDVVQRAREVQRNILAAKQDELRTEARTYPQQKDRDE